jgi:hypothetical protein
MKDLLKLLFIPIIGCLAIGIMFLTIVWGGHWMDEFDNEEGRNMDPATGLVGRAVFAPTGDCDDSYFPVCGDDGETYDNACRAVKAGVTVEYRGVCKSTT